MLPAPETVRYLSFSDSPRSILMETPFVNPFIFRPLVLTGGMMPNWNAELRSGACCAMAGDSTAKRRRMEVNVLFMFIVIFLQNYSGALIAGKNY